MTTHLQSADKFLQDKNGQPESNEAYHTLDGFVSSSMVKELNSSPRIFEGKYLTKTIPKKTSKSFDIGSAVHSLCIEPDKFDSEFVLSPYDSFRTKEAKKWKENQEAEGATVLSDADMATAVRCADALVAAPLVGAALKAEGDVEQSWRWLERDGDESTPPPWTIPCKMRPDKVVPASGVILDLKTTASLDEFSFHYAVADFLYHLQAAHYCAGCQDRYGVDESQWMFVFGVVETKPPFRRRAFELDEEIRCLGRELRASLLSDWLRRSQDGDWSEPNEEVLNKIELDKRMQRALGLF